QLQAQKLRLAHSRGPFYSGSLPNVNQIGTGVPEFQGPSPLDSTRSTRHHGLVERVQRDPRRMMSPLRRYVRQISFVPCPHSPYGPTYLSPPPEPSWRSVGCDSRVPVPIPSPCCSQPSHGREWGQGSLRGVLPPHGSLSSTPLPPLVPLSPPAGPCPGAISRWKKDIYSGCPQLSTGNGCIFPSPDQPANVPLMPSALNTGGSLPDLTTLHFPSPLPTPLDPEEAPYPPLSGGSSTSNLATTMTHLGISGSG
ncbi:CRTC1 protein, partial [Polioptila caerulea]|nr:CRTC1 protein [Polioptila caerulea]